MPPIQLISPCCSAGAGQLGDANKEYPCGPGGDCPNVGTRKLEQTACMSKDTEAGRKCQCVSEGLIANRLSEGWGFKYVYALARVDKPGREIAALTTPITPVFLREFLGKLPEPPEIRGGFVPTGLGNRDIFHPLFQQYWPLWAWTPLDFPQPWWTDEELAIWYDYYNGCGQTPPGFSGEAQRICAAQKYNHLNWVRRGMAERNMEQALKIS